MLQLVELVMISLDVSGRPPDQALSRLDSFSSARRTDFMLRSQKIEADLPEWKVAVEMQDDHRIFAACHREWPVVRRIETEAGPDDDLGSWIKSDEALTELQKLFADGCFALSDASDVAIVEWDTPGETHTGIHVRATLRLNADCPATLTLAAAPDSRDALFAIAHEIAEKLPFLIAPLAIDPALHDPVKAVKLKLPDHATPTDAFVEIGKSVAAHWFGNDVASRGGLEAEHVHQLRVAQRRLKTALKLFPEWIDDAWTTRVAPDLEWFGDLLADARDWDVFTDTTLPAYAADGDDPQKGSWSSTQSAADAKRLAARQRLQDAMNSPRYARLALSFVQWFSQLEAPPDDEHRTLANYVQKRIAKHYRKIARAPDLTTVDARTRHKVRIHAKRLRYALEFFRSLVTRRTRNSVEKLLGNLQSVLGEGNDAAVAAQRLADLGRANEFQKGLARGVAMTVQRMNAIEGERILRKIKPPRIR
jgi:CHAD domain-containing protein